VAEVSPPIESLPSDTQRQLALEVRLRDDATLDNFLASPSVEPLILALQRQSSPEGEAIIYLYGPPGTGKSHLLQGCCHARGGDALYLPLGDLAPHDPEDVLQGAESLGLVCLDDVDQVLGNERWELALFSLCNRARQSGCRLLVSGSAAPRVLTVILPDLRSRLSWGIVFRLASADDGDKADILRFRAARRGLQMPEEVANYITARAPRSTDKLLALLDTLDHASLAEQRALSIPFVKKALGW
jgi:DnaA family protein